MLSGYLTLALVALHYLVDHHQQGNSVDRAFLAFVMPRSWTIQNEEVSQRWTRAFDAAVLFLGDTQVVTSIAIVLSAYVQLPCGLSVYHWEMIVDLAWFSALTHLATLTSLRHYFRRRPAMAVSRVILMGITLVLLVSALGPTGYVPQYGYIYTKSTARFNQFLSSPALCLLNDHRRREVAESLFRTDDGSHGGVQSGPPYNLLLVILSVSYMVIGYVTRVARLSRTVGNKLEKWLRVVPSNFLCATYNSVKKSNVRSGFWTRLRKGILLICITMFEAVCEIANSMLWEVLWLAAALVWGTFRLLQHRQASYLADENTWGFGQVLALLLSALPFWSLLSNLQENIRAPLSIDVPITRMRTVEGIGALDSHAWFLSLVGFLFGTALTFAGGTIWLFAADGLVAGSESLAQGSDGLYEVPGSVVLIYLAAGSCSLFLGALFAALALAFHFRVLGCDRISRWCRRRIMGWNDLAQHRAHVWSWLVFVLLLLGIQLALCLVAALTTPDSVGGGTLRDTK